jgi:uncharacterized membrane protein
VPTVTVLRSAALGFASGGRATAAVALVTARGSGPAWTKKVAIAALASELVGDTLPRTPSRLEIPPFAARILAGTLVARSLARKAGVDPRVPMAVGAVAAVAGTLVGSRWRKAAADAGRPDLPAALTEDGWVLGLATIATL